MNGRPPIILAVDTADLELAQRWVKATAGMVSFVKLGLEFFLARGAEGVQRIQERSGVDLFLDLKLHDIPNTVGKAAQAVAHLQPRFLTVHASGGAEMITAAAQSAPDVAITAVTVLTSLSAQNLKEIGFINDPLKSAVNLALLAKSAGARALVCSPLETKAIRTAVGVETTIITPGVRPASFGMDDQERIMTPRDAITAGANYIVIGRPITSLWKDGEGAMRSAVNAIAAEIG
jgi:orotidine-5'-phosphate decarboxylase